MECVAIDAKWSCRNTEVLLQKYWSVVAEILKKCAITALQPNLRQAAIDSFLQQLAPKKVNGWARQTPLNNFFPLSKAGPQRRARTLESGCPKSIGWLLWSLGNIWFFSIFWFCWGEVGPFDLELWENWRWWWVWCIKFEVVRYCRRRRIVKLHHPRPSSSTNVIITTNSLHRHHQ